MKTFLQFIQYGVTEMKLRGKSRVKRKKTVVFLTSEPDEIPVNTTGYCDSCYDSLDGEQIILVPYRADYGFDRNYLQCPQCHKIIPMGLIPHKSEVGPLGKVGNMSSSSFEVIQHKRRFERDTGDVFKPEDYPLGGREDIELRVMANMGIVVSITDDGEEEEL